jgi:hypothetical protein
MVALCHGLILSRLQRSVHVTNQQDFNQFFARALKEKGDTDMAPLLSEVAQCLLP